MNKVEEQSKSVSENLSKLESEDSQITTPSKIKTRSRFSSAFRSFSKSSNKKKSNPLDVDSELVTSGEEQEYDLLTLKKVEAFEKFAENTKKNKSTLAKKFGIKKLSGIKKYRVSPKRSSSSTDLTEIASDNLVTSSTQTSGSLQRRGDIELKNSSIDLTAVTDNIISGEENIIVDGTETNNCELNPEITAVKFEKVRKIQITIQGKKIEQTTTTTTTTATDNINNLATTTTSISLGETDYLTEKATSPTTTTTPTTTPLSTKKLTTTIQKTTDNKIDLQQAQHSKILVEETLPINTVVTTGKRSSRKKSKTIIKSPNKIVNKKIPTASVFEAIELDQQSEKQTVTQSVLDSPPQERAPTKPVEAKSPDLGKGAIRKTTQQNKGQQLLQQGEHFMSFREKSSSLERGRRYPRGSRANDDEHNIEQPEDTQSSPPKSAFVPLSGNNLINPNLSGSIADHSGNKSKIIEHPLIEQNSKISQETSSIDSQRSQSPTVSESSVSRRKIHLHTDDERANLDGQRDLSGVSEISVESGSTADSQMPAFGDLTMDHEVVPIMTSVSGEKREHLYKILVIGELGTGKTSFIKRYVHQFFSQNYRATIGVDFALKVLHWDQDTIIRLQLWDVAGQERFGNMTRVYYKEAVGAFIVFDVTRSGTFECVSKWKEDLDSKVQLPDGSPIPCILLANKCDQEKQGVIANTEKMDEYVKENGFAGWYETSAKENVNIDEAARALVNKILLNDKLISASDILDSGKFNLAGSSGEKVKTNNCPC